jgi:CRP/FNR family transcriptional regulator, cyclic AMP receptor protein
VGERQHSTLLELDPDLGQLLDPERLETARRELQVAVHSLQQGLWDTHKLEGASPDHIGLLVVDGVLAREVLVSDTISTELLGPGDVLRPWRLRDGATLLQHTVRWSVLTRSRIALLDRRFSAQLVRYPEVNAALIDRIAERALRLTVTQAISQLNRVDRRLLALFWHLAERWGRMTTEGVAIPMTLSHRMLGQLVGARRPTVSTALRQLDKERELVRREDGTWLLTGAPVGMPAPEIERVVPIRRRLLPQVVAPAVGRPMPGPVPEPQLAPVPVRTEQLRAMIDGLLAQHKARRAEMRAAYELTTKLTQHTFELRSRCDETCATLSAARRRSG